MLRAKLLAERSDLRGAEEFARRAVNLTEATDLLELAAGAWLALAEILRRAGDDRAEAAAAEARRRYEEKGNVVGAGWVQAFMEKAGASAGAE